jgi:hypothetical protein
MGALSDREAMRLGPVGRTRQGRDGPHSGSRDVTLRRQRIGTIRSARSRLVAPRPSDPRVAVDIAIEDLPRCRLVELGSAAVVPKIAEPLHGQSETSSRFARSEPDRFEWRDLIHNISLRVRSRWTNSPLTIVAWSGQSFLELPCEPCSMEIFFAPVGWGFASMIRCRKRARTLPRTATVALPNTGRCGRARTGCEGRSSGGASRLSVVVDLRLKRTEKNGLRPELQGVATWCRR